MTICSSEGNDLLRLFYYGDLFQVKGEKQPYIVNTKVDPMKVVAKYIARKEEILIFDGAKYGYVGIFCDECTTEQIKNKPHKEYEIPASKQILEVGYSIDYDAEKGDYDVDEEGSILLINEEKTT